MSQIKTTYKSQETEETLDIILYRPIGYGFALISKKLGITPNTVTVLSMLAGMIGGHFFFYDTLTTILLGIFCLMLSQALDGADGQLARMTNNMSELGRILDGFAGNLVFVSIYIHVCIRNTIESDSYIIWIIVVIAGVSHSLQSAMADYYRNGYLRFAVSPQKGELKSSATIKEEYNQLSWKDNFFKKFLMRVYLNYTIEQELLSKNFLKLKIVADELFNGAIPQDVSNIYRSLSKPLVKYYNILTTNTRLTVLFIALLAGNVYIYFYFEIFVLNLLLLYVVLKQEKISRQIISELYKQRPMVNAAG